MNSDPASARWPSLHVAAAVLRDADGRVLLTQRPAHRDWPGRWEFPGGKVEQGEAPLAALARELAEELGIVPGASHPLIRVPQHQHGRLLQLDVYTVDDYAGTPDGREGQTLRWLPPGDLAGVPMPPADLPVAAALTQPALYAITPDLADDRALLDGIDRLLGSGIRRLQLRLKSAAGARRARLAAAAAARCRIAGAELLLNADVGLAEALGCGLHLTSTQLASLPRRPTVPLLAASCHDAGELERAARLRCDFVVLGPVAATGSHPDARPLGWDGFAALRAASALPVYALGGLGAAELDRARAHGAQGVAAISRLWSAAGPVAATG